MAVIDGQINFSSPACLEQMSYLKSRLNEALDSLSGIQQPPMSTDTKEVWDEHEEMCVKETEKIRVIAEEIFLALTGTGCFDCNEVVAKTYDD